MDFSQIAILIVTASAFGIIAKLLKQPMIIGYLFAGFALAALGLVPEPHTLEQLSKIGVALLLFLVGLEMKLSELPVIGKAALLTGLGQITVTSIIGFLLASLLGFSTLPAIYIAVALTFSSTIIIVKLLSEKNDLDTLYGRIAVGFLLVQDFVAVLILMFLSGFSAGNFGIASYFWVAVKGVLLLGAVWFLSHKVLPKLFSKIVDQSTELLFIVGVAWALGVAALVGGPLGFSIEIGGFLAGIALSNLPDHLQISTRTRPLRDFFLTVFFLMLGTNLVVEGLGSLIFPALLFSAYVLIGNPLIMLVIMSLLGYKKRTSFMASVTVAQISEFSLILMAMGAGVGSVADKDVALVIIVGVITMITSTYVINGADKIFEKIKPVLSFFERKNTHEIDLQKVEKKKNHVVLVGGHRAGKLLISLLKKKKLDFVVVDFNPAMAKQMASARVPVVFGDITEEEIMEAASVADAKLVISTTSDLHDNLKLVNYVRSKNKKASVILKANSKAEAETLYEYGSDYVIVPEVLAGEHIRHILKTYGVSSKNIHKLGKSHLKRLQRIT